MNLKEEDKKACIVLPVMRHSRKGRAILTESTRGLTGNSDGEKSSMAEAEDLAEMPTTLFQILILIAIIPVSSICTTQRTLHS